MMRERICLLLFLGLTCSCVKGQTAKETEPRFTNIDSNELEYQKTVKRAQKEIPRFIERLNSIDKTSISSVKIYIPDGKGKGAFIWLNQPKFNSDNCEAYIFELPSEFENFKVGDRLKFKKNDIQDWFIIDKDGKMEGGYSLRYHRSKLSPKAQKEFDEYIGVKEYL